jgi:hypothetical protein
LWYTFTLGTNQWENHQADFPHQITYGGTLAAGDLNGDRYPEIAVGGNASIPFGSHNCGRNSQPSSGDALQYGQTHLNLGGNRGFALPAMQVVGAYGLRVPESVRHDINSCHGMDNAQMMIADMDTDGKNDVIIAGSNTGTNGPPGLNGQQYDFAVLFNDGTGLNFFPWEHVGPQHPLGTTNGGPANVDLPSIAVGDVTGDGYPDVFVQGHHRDYTVEHNPYVFEDVLFVNNGNRTFRAVYLSDFVPVFRTTESYPGVLNFLRGRPRYVAEGGVAMADFNGDAKVDVLFSGAELPYHTNGINGQDYNTASTLQTYILRNTR